MGFFDPFKDVKDDVLLDEEEITAEEEAASEEELGFEEKGDNATV